MDFDGPTALATWGKPKEVGHPARLSSVLHCGVVPLPSSPLGGAADLSSFRRTKMKFLSLSLVLLLGTLAYAGEKVLYSFQGGSDGYLPVGGLVSDARGNLYGVTQYGGTGACVYGSI